MNKVMSESDIALSFKMEDVIKIREKWVDIRSSHFASSFGERPVLLDK